MAGRRPAAARTHHHRRSAVPRFAPRPTPRSPGTRPLGARRTGLASRAAIVGSSLWVAPRASAMQVELFELRCDLSGAVLLGHISRGVLAHLLERGGRAEQLDEGSGDLAGVEPGDAPG